MDERILLHVRGSVYLSLAHEDEVAIVAKIDGWQGTLC